MCEDCKNKPCEGHKTRCTACLNEFYKGKCSSCGELDACRNLDKKDKSKRVCNRCYRKQTKTKKVCPGCNEEKTCNWVTNKETNEKVCDTCRKNSTKTKKTCPECGREATCNWVKGVCDRCNSKRRKREKAEQTNSVGRAVKKRDNNSHANMQ